MKSYLLLLCLTAAGASSTIASHALLTAVLAAHVKDGLVDYAALKTDARLARYLDQLALTEPATLASDQERLALWLNAYNAYTLQLILDREPAKSITEIGTGGMTEVFSSQGLPPNWSQRIASACRPNRNAVRMSIRS